MFYERIAAIDDDPRSLESLSLALRKNYEVVCFTNVSQALEYLRKPNSVHLVFVDVFMKESDGISVLQEIKKMSHEMQVIIMTGFGTKELIIQALQNDADDFVEKPFDIKELRDKVKRLLGKPQKIFSNREQTPQRIKNFVEKNYSNVSLKDIASEACLSEKYISRMFKQKNNCNFRDFKLKVKIDKAKELLSQTSYPIYHIAEMLGYQNPETFMRIFKRKTRMTPLQYRQSCLPK